MIFLYTPIANLVNVSLITSKKKNLMTLLNTSVTHSAYKSRAESTHFCYKMVSTWLGYHTICVRACNNRSCEHKESLISSCLLYCKLINIYAIIIKFLLLLYSLMGSVLHFIEMRYRTQS